VIHQLATFSHYHRHLDPIFAALPDDLRGDVLDPRKPRLWQIPKTDVVLIAGAIDIDYEYGCRQIYVEHGAGQSYIEIDPRSQPYYHGGTHPENVIGYVAPSKKVADSWGRPAVAVGCPALDWHWARGIQGMHARKTIAITFHWDAVRVCPEARSALDHYIDHLPMIVGWAKDRGHQFIAHAHPRDKMAREMWKRINVEYVDDIDEVLQRASILIGDNSSVLYEAAALGIKTLVLNAPWYRRDVHHGLRFWDAVPGRQFDDAHELVAIDPSFDHSDGYNIDRREAVARAYALRPGGGGAKIAADFVVRLAGSVRP
jgi:hypothetical protein